MIERLCLMSLQGAVLIGVVSILRLFLAKSPKVYSYALWLMVLFRLLCPVLVESRFSLWPDMAALWHWEIDSGRADGGGLNPAGDPGETDGAEGGPAVKAGEKETGAESAADLQAAIGLGGNIRHFLYGLWATGALVTAFVFLMQYIFLRRRIITSVMESEDVCRCRYIGTPFVMGVYKPRIYLPSGLQGEGCAWILQHERMHIRHRHNLIRAAEVIALSLHWWNLAVWYAMHKLNQDMEMFCDEAVLAGKDKASRKAYAETLLDFAAQRSGFLISLSFGRSNTEKRIRHVLRGKRTSLRKTIGMAVVMVFLAAGLLTVPWRVDAAQNRETGPEQVSQAAAAVTAGINVQEKPEKQAQTEEDTAGEFPGGSAWDMVSICGISREQADAILEKLIYDVTAGNRNEAASMFAYPMNLFLEGQKTQIENEEELLSYYELIFTDQMLHRLETWRTEGMFYNWQGVCWGNGALWLQMRDGEIKISVIRNESEGEHL